MNPTRIVRLVVVTESSTKLFDQSIPVPDRLPDLDVVGSCNEALHALARKLDLVGIQIVVGEEEE